ncbi:hypothetical protein HanRHA438_Chr14g0655041 [Helianthus annuus]|nr:hypothetical protein HanRHA438_Chr14g0655041 [Helianthus annuus]
MLLRLSSTHIMTSHVNGEINLQIINDILIIWLKKKKKKKKKTINRERERERVYKKIVFIVFFK